LKRGVLPEVLCDRGEADPAIDLLTHPDNVVESVELQSNGRKSNLRAIGSGI